MPLTTDEDLTTLLTRTRTIAVVGASNKPDRPSYGVMQTLLDQGYRLFPINPGLAGRFIHGQKVYDSLADIPVVPDLVNIFRRSEEVMPIIDAALAEGAKAIWMQEGVINPEAAEKAEAAGLAVVMDRCPAKELRRLKLPRIVHEK